MRIAALGPWIGEKVSLLSLRGALSEPKGDAAIWRGQCLNGEERLLPPINRGRNDMHIRESATVTSEVNTLIEYPRIKGDPPDGGSVATDQAPPPFWGFSCLLASVIILSAS